MKNATLFLLLLMGLMGKAQETDFFVHAHQDDAVFFSGIPLFEKINDGEKTVCIITTAGDQGANSGIWTPDAGPGVTTPFYLARDYGYKKAVEFCYTNNNVPINFAESTSTVQILGKTIRKWTYGNVVMYFLDLPNGECCALNMNGYSGNNYQSIEKLKKGSIPSITDVTNTNVYTWNELKNTIKSIFNLEKGSVSNVYSSDVNLSINPGDHADHYFTSVLALEAMDGIAGFSSKLHTDYELDHMSANLSDSDRLRKISTYGAMISGIVTKGYRANRHIGNPNWFVSEYIRDADAHYELMTLDSNLGGNPYTAGEDNIALNKPTFASGDEPSSEKSKANDGDLDTFWGSTPYPQWWKVDLGTSYKVSDFTVINYYQDSRYYKYKIYVSTDNINWTQVADKSDNSLSTVVGNTYTFTTPIIARYIRVDMSYNSVNQGVHISEFIAHGVPTNIALNKPVFASGEEPSSDMEMANDGDLNTFWGNTPNPQWWKVDLGATYNVSDINVINFYKDIRFYRYKVFASVDNTNWTQVAEKSDNSLSTISGNTFVFTTPIAARYLRTDINYNSKNQGAHIAEFIAHGDLKASGKMVNQALKYSNPDGKNIIFKNPVKKGAEMVLLLKDNQKIHTVEILDLNGKIIFSKNYSAEKVSIDTQLFSEGMYLIKVNHSINSKMIIE